MPIFISQGRFTRDYVRGAMANPQDRYAALSKLCEAAGGRLLSYYVTSGQYDFLTIAEAPDARAVAAALLAVVGAGGVQDSVTTQAFTTSEGKELFELAGKLAGTYKAPIA